MGAVVKNENLGTRLDVFYCPSCCNLRQTIGAGVCERIREIARNGVNFSNLILSLIVQAGPKTSGRYTIGLAGVPTIIAVEWHECSCQPIVKRASE